MKCKQNALTFAEYSICIVNAALKSNQVLRQCTQT